jgi:sugar phosphate isomerase/epimerase
VGFKQTSKHRTGKDSYHQIGLVRGQFGGVDEGEWLKFLQETRFDGWEEASWLLKLDRCGNDSGAESYARERVELARKHDLEIFTVAAHLQGQALGDEPSLKTLQFVGGEAEQAYLAWREKGNNPPRTDPYYVPEDVGRKIHEQAKTTLINVIRLAHFLGKHQGRDVVPVSGFVGSPAHCWSHFFLFPPLPKKVGRYAIPDVREVSLELLVERFAPVLDACKHYGIPFGLECHPSERAMGDLESAGDYLKAMDRAGYSKVAGFNLDGSHMEWQNVSVIQFIREFSERIYCAHVKGVQVQREHCRAGLLGGHRDMGHWANGWNFVTAGTARDANSLEEIFIELNRVGFEGAVSIEWEDNDAEQHAGARLALAACRKADCPPSAMKHDEALKV